MSEQMELTVENHIHEAVVVTITPADADVHNTATRADYRVDVGSDATFQFDAEDLSGGRLEVNLRGDTSGRVLATLRLSEPRTGLAPQRKLCACMTRRAEDITSSLCERGSAPGELHTLKLTLAHTHEAMSWTRRPSAGKTAVTKPPRVQTLAAPSRVRPAIRQISTGGRVLDLARTRMLSGA